MEDHDQTHLTLEKKRMSLAASLYGGQSLWERKQEKKKRGKKIMIKEKEQEEKKASSLSSLCERSETPGALDRHDWESQEANPLPRTVLSASVHITSYQCSGCRRGHQESICVRSWPNPRLDYWGDKCSEPQSASEHATLTNCFQIQYLNPSLLNLVACAMASQYDVDHYDLTLNTSTSYR